MAFWLDGKWGGIHSTMYKKEKNIIKSNCKCILFLGKLEAPINQHEFSSLSFPLVGSCNHINHGLYLVKILCLNNKWRVEHKTKQSLFLRSLQMLLNCSRPAPNAIPKNCIPLDFFWKGPCQEIFRIDHNYNISLSYIWFIMQRFSYNFKIKS